MENKEKKVENYTNLSREAIIKQPTTYTLMPKKVTLTGLKVFAIVMTRLQGFFNDALKARQQRGNVQHAQQLYLDFTPRSNEFEIVKEDRGDISKGDVRFTVKFKELGIAPKNYPAAFQTLMKMVLTPVRIPYQGKVKYTTLMSLDVESGDNAVVLPDGTVDYIKPEVSLVVPRIVANRIFNVELMGYDQYFLHTALYSKSVYTFYIYVFLSGQWFRGNTRIEKAYDDFRAEVGLYNDPSDPDPKRRRAGERYKAWGQFTQSVLEPARKELDESVRTGHAPLSFAYEPIYGTCTNPDTGRTTRAVTHIIFTILPAKGFEHRVTADTQSILTENTLQDKLARFLRDTLRLSNEQVNRVLREVTELAGTDGINQLAEKANALYKRYVVDAKTKASNLGAACSTAIRNFIDNELIRTPHAELVTDPIEAEQARQLVQAAINAPASANPDISRSLTTTEANRFQRVIDALAADEQRGIFADERTHLWQPQTPDVLGTTLRIRYMTYDHIGHDITTEAPLYLATILRYAQDFFTAPNADNQPITPITAITILILTKNGHLATAATRPLK